MIQTLAQLYTNAEVFASSDDTIKDRKFQNFIMKSTNITKVENNLDDLKLWLSCLDIQTAKQGDTIYIMVKYPSFIRYNTVLGKTINIPSDWITIGIYPLKKTGITVFTDHNKVPKCMITNEPSDEEESKTEYSSDTSKQSVVIDLVKNEVEITKYLSMAETCLSNAKRLLNKRKSECLTCDQVLEVNIQTNTILEQLYNYNTST